MKLPNSYTARLAALYALIFSASTLVMFYFFYLFTATYMSEQLDLTIQTEIQGLAESYQRDGLEGVARLIALRTEQPSDAIYLLASHNLQPIAGNLSHWPIEADVRDDWLEFPLVVDAQSGDSHRARAKLFRLPGQYGLLVGRNVHQLTQAQLLIRQALFWGFALMLMLALVGGWLLGRRTAAKIERINQTTQAIMAGDLAGRVPLSANNDDLDELAGNLNRMLDRIQALMEDLRRVSDNIAHDLRTPLTRLRQSLEKASPDDRGGQIQSAIGEADNLLATFNALLRIVRLEGQVPNQEAAPLSLAALVKDVAEFYEPFAEEGGQKLLTDIREDAQVPGDRHLLFQALANLVENALKYSPADAEVVLGLECDGRSARISVADNGPGIPPEERERVFRRFYRLDQSRSGAGNGLGLSLVRAVVLRHNGRIELADNQPGLRAVITLNLPPPARA